MNNVINWFEIPVADMDRAVAFYEPVMQVSLRRETMDCAELAVFPHQDPAPGGPLTLPNDIGTIALFTDSEGNRVGLHQPA
ncbi:TPA: hypothetical protein UMP08_002627 [Klebsiella pneumoniae]|nr:hypothetical protein [Klebsiella pneumoniae]